MLALAIIMDGRKPYLKKIRSLFIRDFGDEFSLEFFITEYQGHATVIAEYIVNKKFKYIVVAGGDGLLNEVINGIMIYREKNCYTHTNDIRVGVFPFGSGNDFARTLRMTTDLNQLKLALIKDKYIQTDVGIVFFYDENNHEKKRYFINITDVGMGGMVVEKMTRYSRKINSYINYQRAIISTFFNFRKRQVDIISEKWTYKGEIMNLIVANGKYFGKGLGIAPHAEPDDGELAIVILGNIKIWDYIKNFRRLRKCEKIRHPEVFYFSAKEIEIASQHKIPVDVDGEFVGYSPVKITLASTPLKIIFNIDKIAI